MMITLFTQSPEILKLLFITSILIFLFSYIFSHFIFEKKQKSAGKMIKRETLKVWAMILCGAWLCSKLRIAEKCGPMPLNPFAFSPGYARLSNVHPSNIHYRYTHNP